MVDSGGSRPQVGAATSQLGSDPVRLEEPPSEVPVALEWVPAWEPVAESAPTIPPWLKSRFLRYLRCSVF